METAIVFRGTDDRKDWWTNGRWLTRLIPTGWDQYNVVRATVDNIVLRARTRNPAGVRVVAAGHSLGGGLAQQAAYAHPGIKAVFAFDPSPVTGYHSVASNARKTNQAGIEILRVYEKGEILAYVRGLLRRWVLPVSERDPAITEVRFNLLRGTAVTQHSMVALTAALAKVADASSSSSASAAGG
jgi:pimeloyl-ACP methyl ester carboxylesterase